MDIDRYLDRIGAARPDRPDLAALTALQEAHYRSVPFENLGIHLGEGISLDEDALFDKIVTRRRGGFCYECNGLFAALLTALGYRVDRLAARVHGEGGYGPPFDHMALRVHVGEPWLVDVGFGDFSPVPLRLTDDGEQPGGYRIAQAGDGDVEVSRAGTAVYRLDPRPYALADFEPTCWWQATSPVSHFTRSLTCSRPTATGRVTLAGARLITTVDGERGERTLGSDGEIRDAYRDLFGIALAELPRIPE